MSNRPGIGGTTFYILLKDEWWSGYYKGHTMYFEQLLLPEKATPHEQMDPALNHMTTVRVGEESCWYSIRQWQMNVDFYDWGVFDLTRFYEKYPEANPHRGQAKVTLDEADKGPDGWRKK